MDRRWLDKIAADDAGGDRPIAKEMERIAAKIEAIVEAERPAIVEAIDEEIEANKDALVEAVVYYLTSKRLHGSFDIAPIMAQVEALDVLIKALEDVRAALTAGDGGEQR